MNLDHALRQLLATLMLLASVFSLSACGSASTLPRPTSTLANAPALSPTARIDAIPSSLIVVPIDPAWVFHTDDASTGRLDDGRTLNIRFARINIDRVALLEGVGPRRQEWLPAPAIWSSSPLHASTDAPNAAVPAQTSTPVMVIDFPAIPAGRHLDVAGKRWAINWVPSPHDTIAARSPAAQSESLALWRPTLPPAAAVSPVLAAYSRPESLSPIGRWRYRMLTDGLAPPGASDAAATSPLPAFDDPLIEAIARQNESRWQSALALLWSVDPDLAWRVKLRLTGVMDFGEGIVVPAWPTDHAILDLLLADLLDPVLSPTQRARRAAEWLEAQPPALAWVVDDAGVLDARKGLGIATIAIANLGERPTLAWAEAEGERREPELRPAPPATVVRVPVTPIDDGRPGIAPSLVSAHLGRWSRQLRVVTRPIPLLPPGLTIGPLLPDLTIQSWLEESRAGSVLPAWATVARLHSPPATSNAPRPFELYVECRSTADASVGNDDEVRVWIGPSQSPFAVLRVSASGTLVDELLPDAPPASLPIARSDVGWSFLLPIPRGAIERDGLLRLALTRTDARGRRSAWPRPMLPWQREPGRIAVDTTAWSDADRGP
jgi:hypothetical protein